MIFVFVIWFFISGGNINFLGSNNVKELKEIIVYIDKRRMKVNHDVFRAKVLYNLIFIKSEDVNDCDNIEIPEIFFSLRLVDNRTEIPFVHMREGDITIRCFENNKKTTTIRLV
ncbi:MAG: hypothetical protein N3A71_00810 [Candidatus Dojkabacteria bacterium]|nr:hypothetical protein [Candidatus Dojkabacteria bacterium]